MSKDTLYEPMRKLRDGYPEWLKNNKEKCEPAAFENYEKQLEMIKEICAKFEAQCPQEEVFDLLGKL